MAHFELITDFHAFELVADILDVAVEFGDELACLVGRGGTLARGLDQSLFFEDTQRVTDFVVRVAAFVRHFHDSDRFVFEDHPQHFEVAQQHVDLFFQSVYHDAGYHAAM